MGSNLGDRLRNLQDAVKALRPSLEHGSAIEKSPVFSTEPVDCPEGSEEFLNAVIVVRYAGTVSGFLHLTQSIECDAGRPSVRTRGVNAPRVVDLDLLYAGNESLVTEELTLPHPRMHQRRFVLEPLARLRPGLVLPGFSMSIQGQLDALQSNEPPLRWVTAEW